MEITGNIGSTFRALTTLADGAFAKNNDEAPDYGVGAGNTFNGKTANFKASRTWKGSTSSNGAHTHSTDSKGAHTHTLTTSSVTDFSVFGKSDTVQPNALKCRVKTRFI